MTQISTEDLAAAVAAFPNWLAADVTTWVRAAEARGTQFPSALAAVTRALSALNAQAEMEATP